MPMSRSFNACPVDSAAKLIPVPATMTAAHPELFPAARGQPVVGHQAPRAVHRRRRSRFGHDDDDDDSLAESLSIVIRSQVR